MENFSSHLPTPVLPGYDNVGASNATDSADSFTNNDPNLGVQVKYKAQSFDRQALGILSDTPKFPQYSTLHSRLQTYVNWPSDVEQTPEVLADAGLIYTGCEDMVRCYFCGGGLKSWDPPDDPWEEHEKWYPNCQHIKLNKESVRPIPTNAPSHVRSSCDSKTHSREKPAEYEDDGLQSVAAQSLLINGVEERKVKRAVKYLRRTKGDVEMKEEDLLMIVFDLEDNDCTDDSDRETETCKENRQLKENLMCKICLDNMACIIFLPCGHMVSCPQCAPAMKKCPICRQYIRGSVKAYLS